MKNGIKINYAYRTFRWDSEASITAHVHCIIVGFSYMEREQKFIYDEQQVIAANTINGYLLDAPNIFIESRSRPICNVNKMDFGSTPIDSGYLSNYSKEEKQEICEDYPQAQSLFKRVFGAVEFINNQERYCIWLKDIEPTQYRNIPPIMRAIEKVGEKRSESEREATQRLASTPYLFGEIRQPNTNYLLIPSTSSERRKYIPIGFMSKDIISTNANLLVPNASMYEFGVLISNVHMAWMRAISGRLKSDYRYSAKIVYNNFPWPNPTPSQKSKIEQTAKAILDARSNHLDSNLADLYDSNTMPQDLVMAHINNDIAVMNAYGFNHREISEADCVAKLLDMYQDIINSIQNNSLN